MVQISENLEGVPQGSGDRLALGESAFRKLGVKCIERRQLLSRRRLDLDAQKNQGGRYIFEGKV